MAYVIPAVISMIIVGIQSMIDGVFLGRYASVNSMASVNIAIPFMELTTGFTMIICTGTLSFLGRTMGENSTSSAIKSKDIFHTAFISLGLSSLVLLLLALFLSTPISRLLGANDILLSDSALYIRSFALFIPIKCFMILFGFTSRLLGRPELYLKATIAGLLSNVVLDYITIKVLGLGVEGAAVATGISYLAGLLLTIGPILKKSSEVNLFEGHFNFSHLFHILFNGSSEGVTSLSVAITVWLFNAALMRYAGEDGVAAFTVINYIGSFVILVMFGVSDGISTLVSYNYGSGRYDRVGRILYTALGVNFFSGILIFLILSLFSRSIVGIFITDSPIIVDMAVSGASIYGVAFLFNGFNIVMSGYQTSLGHSFSSAFIASSRGVLGIFIGMMILPFLFGLDGVWMTIPFAELLTAVLSLVILVSQRRRRGLVCKKDA